MDIQLSNKERTLLEEEKHHEEICIQKYQNYSKQATDPQLKQLFSQLATEEQHHYDMLTEILSGHQPNLNAHEKSSSQKPSSFNGAMSNQTDEILCSDLLSTEKYISSTYNTAIFECVDPIVRLTLQHIQQDEQGHGQQIFDYMNTHGMYTVK